MKIATLYFLIKTRVQYSSVRAVAKKSKLSPATISRICCNRKMDLNTYFKLCKYLGIKTPFSL